ncbi:hypothetical protein A3G67_03455 [Candidatus Roizmanbacteria bacterium RIFCSPLOWO2_12_FULL_40_12]|uniref:AAA+ ATPase domain-containing protein n=1 Tax=Candidatus Roizmanbacteria bacterium RIFCSPLOWO2_01_FULL_40_42 TaxID=1802066 RepID=A0A1F7J5J6_9BACT|nr:MAG: hypothetical protein A2779_03090 [Candidatus Roizmanbacteria bacterium RIFCSPHIGHO2_01_FULL_40_98]OGK28327.1 MAG: hypothetical protein A3C31_00455 [Candidatus Roizmanbacteria bacterium RIFCSPHIGHO2_02_FULL_40_53]OGK30563.1 MAG: hypothetical protein A2W49_03140 [Candidatus Roizmanbacteria bacterium RIFCSPHIGHO2_12_41_18]OGK36977.1 MAG: hypothetical protein A3E69_00715 [Candidatus Roizmanbacteria bacterium RIFCSPHIGHO2_12_FULL_40_130]OGK50883.1 MAG: hypothetical protein A3B50_01225 [Candi
MKKESDLQKLIHNFFEGLVNVFLFLPYFFSVPALATTLFKPWKNLTGRKTSMGFSFEEWSNRLAFNLISRFLGFFMRISILIFFLLIETAYLVFVPVNVLIFVLLLPFLLVAGRFVKSEEERKELFKIRFLQDHSLLPPSRIGTTNWFDSYYEKSLKQTKWWKLENLFSVPPLARDWAFGYTPILDQYTDDLTEPSHQITIHSAVDRAKEIEAIESVLIKNTESNVVLVGEEGVGKRAIIDSLSKRIYEGKSNNLLAYKRILKLNAERVLSEQTDQKKRELFLEELFKEASEATNIILLIENLDRFVSSTQDRVDLSIPLEKFAKTSKLHVVGITTPFLYQKFIFPNEKISRIFTKIDIEEIAKIHAMEILLNLVVDLEKKNNVIIPYETVANTIERSDYYITHIPFPEKAINLLEEACVYALQHKYQKSGEKVIVLPQIVDAVISEKTHIPTQLDGALKNKLLRLKEDLSVSILHQPYAIDSIEKTLQSSFVQLGKRKKPLASFLFLGPTGVGKTETAKVLSKIFFGDDNHLIRFDMSSYQSKEDIPQLIGSLDKQIPGLLTEKIRELPYGVLLLDEIEKAHKDLANIFLTILDEGYFADGYGKHVDCKNLIIVATSNAASTELFKNKISQEQLTDFLIENKLFSPEFLNRFDGVIGYQAFDQTALFDLGKKIIRENSDRLYKLHKIKVEVSDQTLKNLITNAYKPEFGARNLQRVISEEIDSQIAKLILEEKVKENSAVSL